MAPFRNTKKLQNYACSSNHLLELEKPSDVQGEGGDCHTPLRFFWVFFEDDKTSAPDIFSSCPLSLARIETSSVMVSFYGFEIWRHK